MDRSVWNYYLAWRRRRFGTPSFLSHDWLPRFWQRVSRSRPPPRLPRLIQIFMLKNFLTEVTGNQGSPSAYAPFPPPAHQHLNTLFTISTLFNFSPLTPTQLPPKHPHLTGVCQVQLSLARAVGATQMLGGWLWWEGGGGNKLN